MPNGNIFHGEITPDQLFSLRPTPECARYRTPVEGLYLCGSAVHPGGGVMEAPGHNQSLQSIAKRLGEEVTNFHFLPYANIL